MIQNDKVIKKLTCEDFLDDALANGSKDTNHGYEQYEAKRPYLC